MTWCKFSFNHHIQFCMIEYAFPNFFKNNVEILFLVNLGYRCVNILFHHSAFKQHCILSSCCSCHILCCMVQPNQTPPSTAVGQTCCVDFVRLSLLSWWSFTCVKKWIKWECKWFLMLMKQLNALRMIYIRWLIISLLVQ